MKKKIKYTNEPLGKLRIVEDLLPPPEQLALKEDKIRIDMPQGPTSSRKTSADTPRHGRKQLEFREL
jgi:hypothetical protein